MIIREHSKFRVNWDIWILVMVVTTTIVIPFQLAFGNPTVFSYLWVIHAIDLFFLIDIALNFITTFHRGGIEIENRKETVRHYLKTLFEDNVCGGPDSQHPH